MKASFMSLFVSLVLQSTTALLSEYASKVNTLEILSSDGIRSEPQRLTRRVYMPEERELTPRATEVKKKLESLIGELKYHVRDTSFDYVAFKNASRDLMLRLSNVETEVAKLPFTLSIAEQFVYAKGIYDAMSRLAQIANFYRHRTFEQTLLRKLIQLNMGLFYLQDSHSDPNTEMDRYAETVHRLTRVVNYMGQLCEEMTNVSIEVHENLQRQLREARDKIFVLSLPIGPIYEYEI